MSLLHGHHHHHHGHHGDDHGHAHGEHGGDGAGPPDGPVSLAARRLGASVRFAVAFLVVLVAVLAACLVLVSPGEAVVVTRFGNPVRVITAPGLALRIPAPVENTIRVDLRLRTTSSGLQDVGTRDGLRILVQAYLAWQVPDEPDAIRQFLRTVRNQPDEAAEQLRSFIRSTLEITASGFDLANLVNADPAKVQLDAFERRLRERLEEQVRHAYGITIRQVGIESLTLPAETLAATVARMRAERQTVATERLAQGERQAAEIRANADRDARILVAKARTEAAGIEAASRAEAAGIAARAYASAPDLYTLLRSFDALDQIIGANARLILRTDAAPFRLLVDGPAKEAEPAAAKP